MADRIPLNEPQTGESAMTPTGRWLQDQLHDDATAFYAITSGRFGIGSLVVKVQDAIARIEREAQAIPLIDVDLLARALSQSEWNDVVSPPAAMWGYRGWAERIIARLASESSTICNDAAGHYATLCDCFSAALPVKEGEPSECIPIEERGAE